MTDETTDPERETFIPLTRPQINEVVLTAEEVALLAEFGDLKEVDIRTVEMVVLMKLDARRPRLVFNPAGDGR